MWSKTTLFILLIILVSCIDTVESPYPNISPESIQIPAGLERATASSFVINNKAYLTLGRQGTKQSVGLTDCWEFDPTTNSWTRKADFPGKGRVGAIAEVVDGKAYIGFGFNSGSSVYGTESTIFNDFWMYNPQNNSWEEKSSFPKDPNQLDAPLNSCSSFVNNNNIYIVGLSAQTHMYKDVWRYNTTEDKWKRMSDFPGPSRTAAVSCTNGIRYFFGLGANNNDWWEYFPDTDNWKERKGIPGKGRTNAVAFSVDNRFFVATGRFFGGTLTDGQFFDDIMEYDALKNEWYKRGIIPNGARENALAFVIGNNAYIGFGDTDNAQYNDLWRFKP
jgi:N-acetylneuraminic acid mutarotase